MVEAYVAKLESQQVFPIDAGTHSVSGLAIGQSLHKLQQRCQRQFHWRLGWLAARWKQVGEITVLLESCATRPVCA